MPDPFASETNRKGWVQSDREAQSNIAEWGDISQGSSSYCKTKPSLHDGLRWQDDFTTSDVGERAPLMLPNEKEKESESLAHRKLHINKKTKLDLSL